MKNSIFILTCIGVISAFFFSSTFVLNRVIALDGGHWYWSASLRYLYMIFFLVLGIFLLKGKVYLISVFREFINNFKFWVISGCIGFGAFYGLLCYAAEFSPGWIIAATWQLTVIASLLVLKIFGRNISTKIWVFILIIFIGVLLTNFSQHSVLDTKNLFLSLAIVSLAAFCYPIGNQLVWEASQGHNLLPTIDSKVVKNGFSKVLLLSLGSCPLWIALFLFLDTGTPHSNQLFNVAIVAVLSGVIATSLFLYARSQADSPGKLAAIDGSQSGEVIFALGGEILLLGAALPNFIGFTGMFLTLFGLLAIIYVER